MKSYQRETLEGRKRGVRHLRQLAAGAAWRSDQSRTTCWLEYERTTENLGPAMALLVAELDDLGAEYHIDAFRTPDRPGISSVGVAIFFVPDELREDEDLWPAAVELGVLSEGEFIDRRRRQHERSLEQTMRDLGGVTP